MKKTLLRLAAVTLVVMATTAASYPGTVDTDSQIARQMCKVVNQEASEYSGSISFEVEVPRAGTYQLRLWQCAAKLASGELQSYSVDVNGRTVQSGLVPSSTGWGYLSMTTSVTFPAGTSRITVGSSVPAIPNVEFVELMTLNSVAKEKNAAPTKYDDYIVEIKRGVAMRAPEFGSGTPTQPKDTVTIWTDIDMSLKPKPQYDYQYHKIAWFGYTFYTSVYFRAGQTVSIKSAGVNGVSHFLEVFNSVAPGNYSWSQMSDDDGNTNLALSVPVSGIYYVKVRPFKNGSRGLCNLNINNIMTYENVPMCSMGVNANYKISSNSYNIFTTNSESDPFMWVYTGGTYDGVVRMFNNDYESQGNIDWGRNARLSKLSSPFVDRIQISSAGSFDPVGKCELYIGCKAYQGDIVSGGMGNLDINSFPLLKSDDTMSSAPEDDAYNCFEWAAGQFSTYEMPSYQSSPYYLELKEDLGNGLKWFDNYYGSDRYPGCTRYVRTTSIDENVTGGIDLWAMSSDSFPTHASINRNSDSHHHGYAWESKLGTSQRIFHERYALEGNVYGRVMYHYEPIIDNTEKVSLEEAIANGAAVMDKPMLSDSQELFISSGINAMSSEDKDIFNSLYDKWQDVWNHSLIGNPEIIKEDTSYSTLLNECKSNPVYMLFIYDKINKGVSSVIPLFEDLYFTNNTQNKARIRGIREANKYNEYDENGRRIIRTAGSNLKRLLKQLIPDSSQNSPELDGALSGDIDSLDGSHFNVGLSQSQITVNLTLDRTMKVSIDILDLDCNRVDGIREVGTMTSGNYSFTSTPLESGTYLVRCLLNGNLDVKKVIIN